MFPKIKSKPFESYRYPELLKYAHYKLDGHYVTVSKNKFDKLTINSSDGIDITQKCVKMGWVHTVSQRLPRDTAVMGELYIQGRPAAWLGRALGARGADLAPLVRFAGFATCGIGGKKVLPIHAPLDQVNSLLAYWGIETIPFQRVNLYDDIVGGVSPQYLIDTWDDNEFAKQLNAEGLVFKIGNMHEWYKWKPVKTIDCVCVGFTDGRGQHLGLIGSVRCAVYTANGKLVKIGNAGGFTKNMRVEISLEEEKYLGRVCEVQYQYATEDGKLRHPRFKRWRDDKTASECFTNQDPVIETAFNS